MDSKYFVVPFKSDDPKEKRWAISINGVIVDNAQGFGYKTRQAAHKSAWYNFNGGKQKIKKNNNDIEKFEKNNKKFYKLFLQLTMDFAKELSRKETTLNGIIKTIEDELDIKVPSHIKEILINNNKVNNG
jgi:hypothetical protein